MKDLATIVSVCLALFFTARPASAASDAPHAITFGTAALPLTGPWRFHLGDDPRWASPTFDDATWESVDLSAPPGAHDDDVGLSGYVPGWGERGHSGAFGYAWYRLVVSPVAPERTELALAGPAAVESAYQLYVDGQLLGGIGDFTGPAPLVTSIQPRLFVLPPSAGPRTIAIRVWRGSWDGSHDGGGIRIAPTLGERSDVTLRYRAQWLETIEGYVVDVTEPLVFLALAVLALSLRARDPSGDPYRWLAAALLVSALVRANQAVFFWLQCETIQGFEMVTVVLLTPAALAAWLLAWRAWLRLSDLRWTRWAPVGLGAACAFAQLLLRSWFADALPHEARVVAHASVTAARLLFLALFLVHAYAGVRKRGREGWIALPAILLLMVGLFAPELSAISVKGIWFPFGVGVSRTQYSYAAFDVALLALLLGQVRRATVLPPLRT